MTDPLDVLAIGAHPDDAEIGCGGTLILASDAGLRVGVADLTAGERATRGTVELRKEERDRASSVLGLSLRLSLGLPDTQVGADPSHRDALIGLLRDQPATVLLAPYPEDRHPDHAAAGRLVREAAFLAGVSDVGHGRPHRPSRVYHYMLHQPFQPSFVVDVSRVWPRKMAAVEAYGSQFGASLGERSTDLAGGRFLELVGARAMFHGGMIGAERGEAFHSPGPIALGFLPGFHDLGAGGPPGYRSYL